MKLYLNGWDNNLTFSAAHIIPHHNKCGRLHGHTYAVSVEIQGKPDSEGIVMDFGVIKDVLRKIIKDLDHRLIVPRRSNLLSIGEKDEMHILITLNSRRYVVPKDDVVFLDIESSTAENLSLYLLKKLKESLPPANNIVKLSLCLDEGVGQGVWSSILLKDSLR
ncbi:MAG TPA: 6-pyruvoyl tetrahydropterin synthase family protein [Thermoplasmata archaeon]|nr:6-pyruvoyl tetrahydropterin synthase family protein [Thermoplasmata archaeon]